MDFSFYSNKKVLVTGHTGFKGSWMVSVLLQLGADVVGYALEPPTTPSLFEELQLKETLKEKSIIGDVRDFQHLLQVFQQFQPEVVIHLAAQPIVRTSYECPQYTYETNVMGTVNVLECIRLTESVKSFLNVTTDKVYENLEDGHPYEEDEKLDGYDPYSNSKSCSELVTHSYTRSFLQEKGVAVSTARAGNVIGGGDYADFRIIPDCIRAANKGEAIILRNPNATRPFQHVLEPIMAYLMIAMEQERDFTKAGSYNVGPEKQDALTVSHMADLFVNAWGEGASWKSLSDNGPHEANYLALNNRKLKQTFGWKPVWEAKEAVEKAVAYAKAIDKKACIKEQITCYLDQFNR